MSLRYIENTSTVLTADLLPENKSGSNKVVVDGNPYCWDRDKWLRDYQARPGEYDGAPVCKDPRRFTSVF